jgi:hypothetical protein
MTPTPIPLPIPPPTANWQLREREEERDSYNARCALGAKDPFRSANDAAPRMSAFSTNAMAQRA